MGKTSSSRHTDEINAKLKEGVAQRKKRRKTTVQTYGNIVMEIADDGMPIRSIACKNTLEAERIASLWLK